MPVNYCILILSFLIPLCAFSQEVDMEKKVISVEALVDSTVTVGSFLDLDMEQSPVSISVITSEQIQNSGARHLSELLEIYVPGFQYMNNKWNGIIWGMRGVAADRNTKFIFLVNGHKMNHESRDGAISELDLGFLSDLEKVEVLRGPAGLVYGSGSIAGVINLVTKKYTQDKTVAEAAAETWSLKTFGTSQKILYSQGLENGGNLQFYAGYRWSQGSGMETPRIWGRPSWPYPQLSPDPPSNGVPVVGSSWDTPGNFILSADYHIKNWRAYGRVTHQVTNAAGMFVLDPWPEIEGLPDSTATPRMVDGKLERYDGFYSLTESWKINRRQYKVSNISLQVSRELRIKNDQLKLNAGTDLVSNKITLQKLPSYTTSLGTEREYEEVETFGERRFNLTGTYILNRNNFHLATGIDSRLFIFGKDLSGNNAQQEKSNHPIIDNVVYYNQAVFMETVFQLHRRIMMDLGIRYDVHTRTMRHGGFINSRLAMVYTVDPNFNLRLIYQSSGNNGSADNYEHNRNTFNDQGTPFQEPHFEVPSVEPNDNSTPIEPVTREELRSLKPEKAFSYELSGLYEKNKLRALGSVSYNIIKDLFTWNQASFRVMNAGKYNFMNLELDLHYQAGKINMGVNHVFSRLVNTNVLRESKTLTKLVFDSSNYQVRAIDGQNYYYPVTLKDQYGNDSTTQFTLYPVRDGISVDGKNFLNLASNITKIYMDLMVTRKLYFHSSWRLFWGLNGRKYIHNYRPGQTGILEDYSGYFANNNSYPYLGVERKIMVKWNASLRLVVRNCTFQFFVYDLLAPQSRKRNVHSIRWQQMANSTVHTDLYGYDFRSYAAKVTVVF